MFAHYDTMGICLARRTARGSVTYYYGDDDDDEGNEWQAVVQIIYLVKVIPPTFHSACPRPNNSVHCVRVCPLCEIDLPVGTKRIGRSRQRVSLGVNDPGLSRCESFSPKIDFVPQRTRKLLLSSAPFSAHAFSPFR